MIEIKAKLKIPRAAYRLEVKGRLRLPFAQRLGSESPVTLESGEEVRIRLPHGEVLRGGDLVTASDGRVIEVLAEPEKLLHIESGSLARIAYHLGERHVPVQVGEGFLRIAADPALEEMARKLGAKVSQVEAPFEPEAGAHAAGRRDGHDHDHDHDHPHHHH
jgi:urease accessory protein